MAGPLGAIAVLVVGLVCAAPASAFQNEGHGFEQLTFGQSVDQTRKLFPDMRKLGNENLGASAVASPSIERYLQPEVRIEGLAKPVSLELRFWKQRLWVVIAYYGSSSPAEITTLLERRHGKPTHTSPDPAWLGEHINITTSPKQGWFSVGDNAISKEVQTLFMKELQGSPLRRRVPPRAGATVRAPAAPAE